MSTIAWAPWDMPDGTFQRVYDLLDVDDRRALRAVSREGKALVHAHARAVDMAPLPPLVRGPTSAFSKKDVKALLRDGPMYQLRHLRCPYNTCGTLSLRRLTAGAAPVLQTLDLGYTDLDPGSFRALVASPLRTSLRELKLGACKLGILELAALCESPWPSLRALDLARNHVHASPPLAVQRLMASLPLSMPSLVALDVSHTGSSFASTVFEHLPAFRALEELRIDGTGPALLPHIPPSAALPLKKLSFGGGLLDEAIVDTVLSCFSPTLESLSLAGCRVRVSFSGGFPGAPGVRRCLTTVAKNCRRGWTDLSGPRRCPRSSGRPCGTWT
jgi:hypothetical protein